MPSAAVQDARPRCVRDDVQYTIEALGAATVEDPERLLPFAVEVGAVLVDRSGFSVPLLRGDGERTRAGLLRASLDLSRAVLVELTAVHGAAAPPRVVRSADGWVVVVADSDASGGHYRLGTLTQDPLEAASAPEVRWGLEVDELPDDSPVYDVATSGSAGLLVWDQWDRASNRSRILGTVFSSARLEERKPKPLSPALTDAEAPRLAMRRGGYWLAWLALGAAPVQRVARSDDPESLSPVEIVERRLELMRLDPDGNPEGAPIAVDPGANRVVVQGFDMLGGHDDGVLVVWREQPSGAGLGGGVIKRARVGADGSVEVSPVEADAVGATPPTLLYDPAPNFGAPHGWLTLEAPGGTTALAGLSPAGEPLESLRPIPSLGAGSVLAAAAGRLLVAQPRGRKVELGLVTCSLAAGQNDALSHGARSARDAGGF